MATKVEKTITVNVPISTAYNQWTQFEDFPQFMSGIQQVEQLDETRLHWVAEIGGVKREWYATILEQRPDDKIAWAATEGATNAGAVYFTAAGAGQTSVTLELEYEPEGVVEQLGDKLNIVSRQAESDLERFKTFIESRHDETGAWRGRIDGPAVGTPGVESASSEGDSGKVGISGKAAAAGVAAAAAGVAAVVAARSGSDEDTETSTETVEGYDAPPVEVVEETTYIAGPATETTIPGADPYGVPAAPSDDVLLGGAEHDGASPATDDNDGRPLS